MNRKKLIAAFMVFLLIMLSVIAAGCAGKIEQVTTTQPVASKEKVVVYGAEFEYDKVNPVLATTNVDNLIFTSLTKFNEDHFVLISIPKE